MVVKLVLGNDRVNHLIKHLGEGRVKILELQENGYSYVQFDVKSNSDVLSIFHAGTDAGLELGLYGPSGKPKSE